MERLRPKNRYPEDVGGCQGGLSRVFFRPNLLILAMVVTMTVFSFSIAGAQAKRSTGQSGPRSQGGTLVFGSPGEFSPNDSSHVEIVALEGYVGEPLKALQLRVISGPGVRLRSVERGSEIVRPSEWNFSHVIVHGANGFDTAKVVLFGMGHTALPARPYSVLLKMTYEVLTSGGAGTAMLTFSDVLGALSRGEDANISAGPPRTISFKKDKRK